MPPTRRSSDAAPKESYTNPSVPISQPGLVIRGEARPLDISTTPSACKRKASVLSDDAPRASQQLPARKKLTPETDIASALLASPVPSTTTASKMDSDDDFNSSQASGDEFQDSDYDMDEGKSYLCCSRIPPKLQT